MKIVIVHPNLYFSIGHTFKALVFCHAYCIIVLRTRPISLNIKSFSVSAGQMLYMPVLIEALLAVPRLYALEMFSDHGAH